MNQPKKSGKGLRRTLCVLGVLLVILIVVLLVLGTGAQKPNGGSEPEQTTTMVPEQTDVPDTTAASEPEQTAQTEATAQTEPTAQTERVAGIPTEAEPVYGDVEVPATYCKLYYSGQWADSIRAACVSGEFAETVLFYGTVEGKEALLFAVYFADATDNSFPVGVYLAENGLMVDVSAEICELPADGWTDEGFDQICAMQEQINYVIEKLNETDGFTLAQ